MKFFALLALFLLVVWLLRGGRRSAKPPAAPYQPDASQAPLHTANESAHEDIVACAHCGVHLPQSEAVQDAAGWFCSEPHRIAHEKAPPA